MQVTAKGRALAWPIAAAPFKVSSGKAAPSGTTANECAATVYRSWVNSTNACTHRKMVVAWCEHERQCGTPNSRHPPGPRQERASGTPFHSYADMSLSVLRGAALEASFDDARQEAAVRGRAWLGQGPHEEGRRMRAGWGGCGLVLGGRGRGKQGKGYK